jgi:hypothetical protein
LSPTPVSLPNEPIARSVSGTIVGDYSGTGYGRAQSEPAYVSVVKAATSVSPAKLTQGAGSCTLGARQLKAGSPLLSASYPGDQLHYGSGSPVEKITVVG